VDDGTTCPKDMRFGPCGGTRPDGGCETGDRPCPFVAGHGPWRAPDAAAPAPGPEVPVPEVIVDVREPPGFDGDLHQLWRETATVLSGAAALIGEHADRPVDDAGRLAVADVVRVLGGDGIRTIATVTGRDRSRARMHDDIAALRRAGALAVHCVTGDHPGALGIDRRPRWGGESFDLIGIAVEERVRPSAAESPASPGPRVERLVAKQRAGAAMVILNHGGDAADLVEFARRCRAAGATVPLVAPVPLVVDPESAARLDRFPGLRLPTGLLAAVATARSPRDEGIRRAAALAIELLEVGMFAGVNLSGPAGIATADARLAIQHETLAALAAGRDTSR